MTTHISYKTAKRLKEFLGERMPKPMDSSESFDKEGRKTYPVNITLKLHDVLSKPFCEAMAKKVCPIIKDDGFDIEDYWDIALIILRDYQDGGLPAVGKALIEMMEGK